MKGQIGDQQNQVAQNPRIASPGSLNGGLLRLPQVLAMYPIGKSTWWEGVKTGRYPKPIRISTRCVAWRMTDIHALLDANSVGVEA